MPAPGRRSSLPSRVDIVFDPPEIVKPPIEFHDEGIESRHDQLQRPADQPAMQSIVGFLFTHDDYCN